MRIVEIRERTVPLSSTIENAIVSFREMTASLVAIVAEDDRGRRVTGFGFNSNGRYAVGGLLRERFIPRLLAAEPAALLDQSGTNFDPAWMWQVLMTNEKPGGHGERAVAVGTLDLAAAIRFGEAIEPYGLKWYEEAGDPHDFELQAELGRRCRGPFATGENLFAMVEARNLVRYAGMDPGRDFLQFDPALSYGIVEYLRTIEMLEANGWSRRRCIPHGGHQLAVHLAAGLGLGGSEAYPGVFAPFGGFADDARIEAGYVRPGDLPGIGIEARRDLYALCRELVA